MLVSPVKKAEYNHQTFSLAIYHFKDRTHTHTADRSLYLNCRVIASDAWRAVSAIAELLVPKEKQQPINIIMIYNYLYFLYILRYLRRRSVKRAPVARSVPALVTGGDFTTDVIRRREETYNSGRLYIQLYSPFLVEKNRKSTCTHIHTHIHTHTHTLNISQ